MPNRQSSNRIGWNQRGPGIREEMQWARELSNPDSYHWQNKAINAKFALIEVMGIDGFLAFAESIFPGQSINDRSWQQIHDAYAARLAELQDG
jgi:hypothetical protein